MAVKKGKRKNFRNIFDDSFCFNKVTERERERVTARRRKRREGEKEEKKKKE